MEHLFYRPTDPRGPARVMQTKILDGGFDVDKGNSHSIKPITPWLGFSHDKMPRNSFRNYATSSGWTLSNVWNGLLSQSHDSLKSKEPADVAKDVASILQSWLYMALLESFLDKKVRVSYMTRQHNGAIVLDSSRLATCLQGRVFELRLSDNTIKDELDMQIQNDIFIAQEWVSRFFAWSVEAFTEKLESNYPGFMKLIGLITPAIVRLAEVLECARMHAFPDKNPISKPGWHYPLEVAKDRNKQLLDLGWCPFTISFLEQTTSQSVIDWVVAKQETSSKEEHEKCNSLQCHRNNIDPKTYKQQHHIGCSGCKGQLKPDFKEVVAILESGQIPTIRLTKVDGQSSLEVCGASLGTVGDYVAISHVWVDGIGGTTESGLWECQVSRLQQLACDILKTDIAFFWVDTLCIPKKPPYRRNAIVQMRWVYENAAVVLVIDKSIRHCSISAPVEDILLTIYTSAWMKRLWTYHEAVLASRLTFSLNDGLFEYSLSQGSSMGSTVNIVWRSLASNLYRLRANRMEINVGHIYAALRWRSTSRDEDEFLAVCNLLRLKSAAVVDAKDLQEKARIFWLQIGYVPFNIPLLDGPKLSIPHFRWAPSTLRHLSEVRLDTETGGIKSRCTEDGLFGEYIIITNAQVLLGNRGLQGKGSKNNSIFHIYMQENRSLSGGNQGNFGSNGLLRIYCVESWPEEPQKIPFDTILFASEHNKLESGQWIPAAALQQLPGESAIPPGSTDLNSQFTVCSYVGRLLVERLRPEELVCEEQTIMYAGATRTVVNTTGIWSLSRLCIR